MADDADDDSVPVPRAFRRAPGLGTEVEMLGAFKGKKGVVIENKGRTVVLRMKDGNIAEVAWQDGLALWTRHMPLVKTEVTITGIPQLRGVQGVVKGYIAVKTNKRVVTAKGVHHGSKACVIETQDYGILPIMLENLDWNPNHRSLQNQEEESCLPPAGPINDKYYTVAQCKNPYDVSTARGAFMSKMARGAEPTRTAAASLQTPATAAAAAAPQAEKKKPRTALHQLILDNQPVKTRTIRMRPALTAAVKGSLTNRQIVSVYIEYPHELPKGWAALSSGGFIKEECPGPTLRRLRMDCHCDVEDGQDLPSEEAARLHFELHHPFDAYRITISGTMEEEEKAFTVQEENEYMRIPPPARPLPFTFKKPDPSPPYEYSTRKHFGLSPAWFDIRKAGQAQKRQTGSLYSLSRVPKPQGEAAARLQ